MRSSLKYAISKLGKIEKSIEVGVRDGLNSLEILKGVDFLYLVDNYPIYDEMWSGNKNGEKIVPRPEVLDRKFQDRCKELMLKNIEPFKDRVKFFELSSVEASKQFEDKSLDYIYIDACHNYEHVLEDLKAWYPKIKDSGVISGHDFNKPHFPGVTKAVIDFATENNLKVVYSGDSDYWLKKKQLRIVSYFYEGKFKPYREYLNSFRDSVKDNGYELTCYEVEQEDIGISLVDKEDISKPGNAYYVRGYKKPTFIKEVLDKSKDDIVWMDIDCVIQKSLGNPLEDCDVAVTLRRLTDRVNKKFFEGYLNTGVMFFKNNSQSRKFCDLWQENIKENECDQDGANKLLLKYSKLEQFNEIIEIEGIKVKILSAEEYNFFYFPEDSTQAKVLHYKGFSHKGEFKR